jgi:hypothetical protein
VTGKPNAITDGTRAFYEQAVRLAATEMPGTPWPAYDDLTGEQLKLWTLVFAATAEVSVRMTDALMSLGIDAS